MSAAKEPAGTRPAAAPLPLVAAGGAALTLPLDAAEEDAAEDAAEEDAAEDAPEEAAVPEAVWETVPLLRPGTRHN
jgi:hypothetical protein